MGAPPRATRRMRPRARGAALASLALLLASASLASASFALFAIDEAAALDAEAAAAAGIAPEAAAAPVVAAVAPPTDAVDEVAAWFAPDIVERLKGAVVRVQPTGRGLFIDDAAAGVATVANGVLLAADAGGAGDGVHRYVATTWRAVNPGFANYTVAFADGGKVVARLARYDPGRPVAILAVDAAAVADRPGAALNPAAAGLQVGDPLLGVGLVEDAPVDAAPAAWSTYVGYAYDLHAALPRAEGVASPLRNVRALVARSLITRPWLAPGAGLFDVGGTLVGLDIEGDLTAAGVGGKKAETFTLPAVYVRDAVRDAALELIGDGEVRPRRGDVGAGLTLISVGMAVQYYNLDAASARAAMPAAATTEDGAGTAPKVIKIVGLDVDSVATGLLAPGDIVLAVDGGAPLGDDLRAFEIALTKALTTRDGVAIVTVSRDGALLDVRVPVADLNAARTTRAATFAGCTFQDVPLAVQRKYQQERAGSVMLTTCAGAAAAEAAAEAESRVAAARATAFAKPLGPAAALLDKNRMKTIDPGARVAVEYEDSDDDSAVAAALGGPKALPSPLLATLMRTRDVQAPVTPTLVTGLGGVRVASLDDLIKAARAVGAAASPGAPATTSVSFKGIHAGRGSFQMVDKLDLPASAAAVKELGFDQASLQWVPVFGGAVADAAQQRGAAAVPDAAMLPSEAAEIVIPAPRKAAATPAAPAAATAFAAPPTPGSNAMSAKAIQGMLMPATDGDDQGLRMSAVEDDGSAVEAAVDAVEAAAAAQQADVAASSSSDRPAPASLLAWLALAAKARGPVPIHSSQTWNASQVAAFKRQAVTITIYDWYPLEHNTAASKATGSGFVVDAAAGIIATNAHVAGATVGGWEVLFFDGSTAAARSIWYSPQEDIAFLKVDPAAIPYPDAVAPLASWTTFPVDRAVADGDFAPVLSVGSPGSYPFAAMQGVYLGESYRATDDIGGLRARNYIKLKTLIQSAGGASGGPVFNANGSIVGIHFAGGTNDDARFKDSVYWRESLEVAADYIIDALDDGVRELKWPTRGALGLEYDLIPIPDAVKYYGLPAAQADGIASVVAAAAAAAAPEPASFPRPGDRVILVTGVEPGAPTAASTPLRPGDIVLEADGRIIAGDLRALERALHPRVNATVPLTVYRYGQRLAVDAPVYDMTADRVKRFAVYNGAVLHDVSDRTRFAYRTEPGGVFVAHRADGSSWPRFRHAPRASKTATMQAKYVVTRLAGVATPDLAALVSVACRVARDAPVVAVARDLQGDDYATGGAWEMWLRPQLDALRVFEWDGNALAWRQVDDPCAS